ncbi:MAG: hypothetical protein AAF790_11460 [Planctomycetota bacterium]
MSMPSTESHPPRPHPGPVNAEADWWRPLPLEEHSWRAMLLGVCCTCVAIALFWVTLAFAQAMASDPQLGQQPLRGFPWLLMAWLGACFSASLTSAFVGGMALMALNVVTGVLGVRVRRGSMACILGGLVVSVMSYPGCLAAAQFGGPIAVAFWTGLAVLLGQLGTGVYVARGLAKYAGPGDDQRPGDAGRPPAARFRVRQMLVVMTLAGVTLAALRLAGALTALVVGVAAALVAGQVVLLQLSRPMVDRCYARRVRRLTQMRST